MSRRPAAPTCVVALLLFFASALPVLAQSPPEPTAASSSQAAPSTPPTAEELEQRIRVLERKLELADEAATAKAKTTPSAIAGADGFGWKSGDGAFGLKLRGLLQSDGRFTFGDDRKPTSDTLLIRRARPIVEAVFFKDFELRLMSDFGDGKSQLLDAQLDWKPSPLLRLRAGKFKVPVGLEALLSDSDLPFVERGFPSALAPVRDVGLQASGEPWSGRLAWAAGLFNGLPDGATGDSDSDDDKEIAARIFVRPLQRSAGEPPAAVSLGVGLAATTGRPTGTVAVTLLPSYRTAGNQSFFSYRSDGTVAGTAVARGDRQRLAPQGWLYVGSFGALAEWTRSSQEVVRGTVRAALTQTGWQLVLSWVASGESLSERGVSPRRPVSRGKGRGALLLAARAGELAVDRDAFPLFADPSRSARRALNLGASVNWILNRNVKLVLDYERTAFDGGDRVGTALVDRDTEQLLLTRVQLSF